MSPNWARLFPDADYRPAMNLRVIDGPAYFARRDTKILEMRLDLLRQAPDFYRCGSMQTDSLARFLGLKNEGLSEQIEPDWVLLRADSGGRFVIQGGCVCFPTMWSLPEKLGLPLAAVHAPVPGLNAVLGKKIDAFLTRLVPAVAYGRENWGLAASEALDQHPRHGLAEIAPDALLSEVWLRVEEQVLVGLDDGQIVFGIRIVNQRLDQLPPIFPVARLARALRNFSPAMAAYKRLTDCRERIASELERFASCAASSNSKTTISTP